MNKIKTNALVLQAGGPTAVITTPTTGAQYAQGASVVFSGSATDAEDALRGAQPGDEMFRSAAGAASRQSRGSRGIR